MINKRLLSLTVAGVMLLGLASLASAGIPDDTNSTASVTGSAGSGAILVTPAGTGNSLSARNLTVTVTVRDTNNDPIAAYPFQDMWLDDIGNGDISLCQGGSVADGNTNASGVATFSGALAAGGWTESGLQVYLAGTPLAGAALAIDVVSCDINKDLVVDISDIGLFGQDFASPTYSFRSDFTVDGVVDLSDVGSLGIHNTETCP